MRMKLSVVLATSLVLAATTASAWKPTAQTDPGTAQGIANQTPSFGDDTTGPTNPRARRNHPVGLKFNRGKNAPRTSPDVYAC
jgi:hypothetical protein